MCHIHHALVEEGALHDPPGVVGGGKPFPQGGGVRRGQGTEPGPGVGEEEGTLWGGRDVLLFI